MEGCGEMANTTITSAMLGGLRQHIVDMVDHGRYMIDGTWRRVEINSKAVQENGSVHVTFYIRRADGSSSPATRFQLRNRSNQVLAERTETVAFVQHMDAILYRFKFGVSVSETPGT